MIVISDHALQIIICGMIGLLGTIAAIYSLVVIRRCQFLTGIVEHYCLIHASSGVVINACHTIWAVPCAIWDLNAELEWISYVFGFFIYAIIPLAYVARVSLAINRWFSVAFHGRYYHHLEEQRIYCYAVLVVLSAILIIPLLIPGCRCSLFTSPVIMFWTGESAIGGLYVDVVQIKLGYVEIAITATLEVSTLLLLSRRLKKLERTHTGQSRRQVGRQLRFAGQLVTFNTTEIAILVVTSVCTQYAATDFHMFLLFTASWQFGALLGNIIYIVFQRRSPKTGSGNVTLVQSRVFSRH
ncbi:unnamed protein product, partial [Mesorhabditis spiculigera]